MSECIYWMEEESRAWCDLAQGACMCKGNDTSCSVGGNRVTGALKAERKADSREAFLRAQKKRMHAEADHRIH